MKFYRKEHEIVVRVPTDTLESVLVAVKRKEFKDLEASLKAMGPALYDAFGHFSEGEILQAVDAARAAGEAIVTLEGSIYPDEASAERILEKAKRVLEEARERQKKDEEAKDAPFVARAVAHLQKQEESQAITQPVPAAPAKK